MRRIAYAIWQVIWGMPQTAIGTIVLARYALHEHFLYHGVAVTKWNRPEGLSLGLFVFVPEKGDGEKLLDHEYGHTIQSAILGPMYLIAIGLPSAIWAKSKRIGKSWRSESKSYYSMFTERWANTLAQRVLHCETPL